MSLSFVMSDSHVIPAVAIVAASFVGFVWLAVAKGWLYPLFAGIGYLAVALVWADVVSALHDPNLGMGFLIMAPLALLMGAFIVFLTVGLALFARLELWGVPVGARRAWLVLAWSANLLLIVPLLAWTGRWQPNVWTWSVVIVALVPPGVGYRWPKASAPSIERPPSR